MMYISDVWNRGVASYPKVGPKKILNFGPPTRAELSRGQANGPLIALVEAAG